jgi:putative membrane protein
MLAKFTAKMISDYHDPTYGFFFGLILISVIVPFKTIKKKNLQVILSIIIAIGSINTTSIFLPESKIIEKEQKKFELKLEETSAINTEEVKVYSISRTIILFFSGALAVSAMVLPGISGSFVLLMLGQYFFIIKAISDFNILYLSAVGFGVISGILLFTRILNFFLEKFHDTTMAFLTGLVIGSLFIIWPFKNSIIIGDARIEGYPETIFLGNIFPEHFGSNELFTLFSILAGCIIVISMILLEKKLRND